MKLSNIAIVNREDEWCVNFYFGEAFMSMWFYKEMTPRQIVQVLLGTIKNIIDNLG